MFQDRHHLLSPRQEWRLRPEAKALREDRSLIVRLDRSEHNEIHRHCPPVPLLGFYALQRVNKLYEPGDTPLESIENLMQSIEASAKHPRVHEIEKQLAGLAVWSLDLQRPFIADKRYE